MVIAASGGDMLKEKEGKHQKEELTIAHLKLIIKELKQQHAAKIFALDTKYGYLSEFLYIFHD